MAETDHGLEAKVGTYWTTLSVEELNQFAEKGIIPEYHDTGWKGYGGEFGQQMLYKTVTNPYFTQTAEGASRIDRNLPWSQYHVLASITAPRTSFQSDMLNEDLALNKVPVPLREVTIQLAGSKVNMENVAGLNLAERVRKQLLQLQEPKKLAA